MRLLAFFRFSVSFCTIAYVDGKNNTGTLYWLNIRFSLNGITYLESQTHPCRGGSGFRDSHRGREVVSSSPIRAAANVPSPNAQYSQK